MEQLPNHIKIQILNFIPRRVHPTAIMMRTEIDECVGHYTDILYAEEHCTIEALDMWDEYYDIYILHPYKFGKYCDCCAERWKLCLCMCHCCQGPYNVCKYGCYPGGFREPDINS